MNLHLAGLLALLIATSYGQTPSNIGPNRAPLIRLNGSPLTARRHCLLIRDNWNIGDFRDRLTQLNYPFTIWSGPQDITMENLVRNNVGQYDCFIVGVAELAIQFLDGTTWAVRPGDDPRQQRTMYNFAEWTADGLGNERMTTLRTYANRYGARILNINSDYMWQNGFLGRNFYERDQENFPIRASRVMSVVGQGAAPSLAVYAESDVSPTAILPLPQTRVTPSLNNEGRLLGFPIFDFLPVDWQRNRQTSAAGMTTAHGVEEFYYFFQHVPGDASMVQLANLGIDWVVRRKSRPVNPTAPVDCVRSPPTDGACSVECGGGFLTRTYTVVRPAQNGGACILSERVACNQQPCIVTSTSSSSTPATSSVSQSSSASSSSSSAASSSASSSSSSAAASSASSTVPSSVSSSAPSSQPTAQTSSTETKTESSSDVDTKTESSIETETKSATITKPTMAPTTTRIPDGNGNDGEQTNNETKKLTTGAIVGIAVGSASFIVLVACAIVYAMKSRAPSTGLPQVDKNKWKGSDLDLFDQAQPQPAAPAEH